MARQTMTPAPNCQKCGAVLGRGALSGLCPRCLGQILLGGAREDAAEFPATATRLRYVGDYELQEEIAHGGMGVVFKAQQLSLKRIVAVKMIRAGELAGPEAVRRFHKEAQAAAALQHPNIVAIHEIGEHEGQPYYSMDFVDGKDLAQVVHESSGHCLPARRAAGYVQSIAAAVHYAHQRGILHRDLKPSNVLIDAFDQPRITDFGLAKQFNPAGSELELDPHRTRTHQQLGTPAFMSPEQVSPSRGATSPKSDVYALGAVLYFLLTGRAPFDGENAHTILARAVGDEPLPLTRLNPNVPRDLETIALKCLEKEPRRRYANAQELAEELDRFLRGEPIRARPISVAEKFARSARRHRAIWLAAGATGALVAACAILLAVRATRPAFPPMPHLSGQGVSAIIDGQLLVTTGLNGYAGHSRQFDVCDLKTRTWKTLPERPISQAGAAGGELHGKLYLAGGTDDSGATTNLLSIYDPRAEVWSFGAPLPTARIGAAAVVLGKRLYVLGGDGGYGNHHEPLATMESYDPETDTWRTEPPLKIARVALVAAAIEGKIYAVGGNADQKHSMDAVECFDPATGEWKPRANTLVEICRAAAAVFEGKLYLFGGFTTSESAFVQVYDPQKDEWEPSTAMPVARYSSDGAQVVGSQIVVIGGWSTIEPGAAKPDRLPRDTVLVFDPTSHRWLR